MICIISIDPHLKPPPASTRACLAVCPGAVALIIRYNYHCNLSVIMRPTDGERERLHAEIISAVLWYVGRRSPQVGPPLSLSLCRSTGSSVFTTNQPWHDGQTRTDGDARSPIWLLLRLLTPIIRPRPHHNTPETAFDQVCDRIVH